MRADRLLRLLMLLQRHGHLKASALADELEVSVRTVLRDMEALSTAGVPVWTERGPHGGCHLLEGWHTRAAGLTVDEAQALFSWAGRQRTTDLGLGGALGSALGKLADSAPAGALQEAEALGDVVLSDRRRWFDEADRVGVLPQLRVAASLQRQVVLSYRSSEAALAQDRTVHPVGLVDHSGRWYLVAEQDGVARMFRVSRVQGLTLLEDANHRLDRRPLAEIWADLRERLEARQGHVEFLFEVSDHVAGRFRRLTRMAMVPGTEIEETRTDAGALWRFAARTPDSVCAMAVMFAHEVELLEPRDLRERVLGGARAALARYEAPG